MTASVGLIKWPRTIVLSFIQMVAGSLFLYLGVVSNSLWNYNTHVLIISVLTFITSVRMGSNSASFSAKNQEAQKDLAAALSLVFATIYYQAALSKIVVSGMDWMISGLSIYLHLLKFNPTVSGWLDGNPITYQLAGWLTVIGELTLGTLFVFPRTRKLAAVFSTAFHIMLWFTFHISFWHLWIFYPAVYFTNEKRKLIPIKNEAGLRLSWT